MDRPTLHYANIDGYDIDAMRAALRLTPLYQQGDCRLVWVNEGDLGALAMRGQANDLTAREPEPVTLHGFTITAAPERHLVGIEVSEHGAFSPEAADALADALRSAAQRARGDKADA